MISLQTSLASLLFLVAALAAPIDMSQHEDADVTAARTSLNHHSEPMHPAVAEIYKRPDITSAVDEIPEVETAQSHGTPSSRPQNKFSREEDEVQGLGIAPKVLKAIRPTVEYVADLM